ncbi:protease modulator HflK [Pantoea sp. EA-12]|uniref:protease modulator HflK n=1 Tax=Pantoea sp. EA-12 TaxID=3043303 RepID=UPI0024B5EC09|nr:protease modulator HflK [Pantoea sp. EA-12]MDI9221532.1 protease modulator HflK [Pantoea sp. EA-12]
MSIYSDENSHTIFGRMRNRLRGYRACSLILLILSCALYYYLLTTDGFQAWRIYSRTLVAVHLLIFVVIENVQLNLSPSAGQVPSRSYENEKLFKRCWGRLRTSGVRNSVKYLYQHTLTSLLSVLAIYLVIENFNTESALPPITVGLIPIVCVLVIICFSVLVIERMLSFKSIRQWPCHSMVTGLTRVLLSILLLMTVALALNNYIPTASLWVVYIACGIIFLIAVEFIFHSVAHIFILPREGWSAPFLCRSMVAECYHWPLHPLLLIRKKIYQHFGVDIGKIQAFALMARIFTPVLLGIVFVGWLISGLHQIPLSQRGVYERFGQPVNVLLPGIHIGLPWPFGRVRPVDYGAVYELQLSDERPSSNSSAPPVQDRIEGPAPQDSWRLWDNTHSTDQAQVIASSIGDKQSFQIVNMDIRIIWRVGLQDADAMNSLYHADDLPTTIQRVARQVLTQYFAHQQLDVLLNEQRAGMSVALNNEIKQRLRNLNLGVELLFTRIESIHPPAGAANAYHGVQAAQIAANALIAREKGYAAALANDSQRVALTAINTSQAFSHEQQALANNALTRYSAEHDSWEINPQAFINERRYQILSKALSHTPLLILDDEISAHHAPILDLRQFWQTSESNK